MRWTLKLFGLSVAEINRDDREVVLHIDNTGGDFSLAGEALSASYEEDEWEASPDDPEGFGFRRPR